jgi:hypothetical protein
VKHEMKKNKDKSCCQSFSDAQKDGTDNEGYGPLIWKIDDEYQIGFCLPDMKFCPWCGRKIKMECEDVQNEGCETV